MSTHNEPLARLLTQQQSAYKETDAEFAARFGKSWRTYFNWRTAEHAPAKREHATIEESIGWKIGSIGRLLSGEGTFLSLGDVQDLPVEDRPVERAALLTDDELLTELTRRFKTYAATAMEPPTDVPEPVQVDFAQAARHQTGKSRKKPSTNE